MRKTSFSGIVQTKFLITSLTSQRMVKSDNPANGLLTQTGNQVVDINLLTPSHSHNTCKSKVICCKCGRGHKGQQTCCSQKSSYKSQCPYLKQNKPCSVLCECTDCKNPPFSYNRNNHQTSISSLKTRGATPPLPN